MQVDREAQLRHFDRGKKRNGNDHSIPKDRGVEKSFRSLGIQVLLYEKTVSVNFLKDTSALSYIRLDGVV